MQNSNNMVRMFFSEKDIESITKNNDDSANFEIEDNIVSIIPSIVEKYWDYEKNEVSPINVSMFSNKKYYWKNSTNTVFKQSPLDLEFPFDKSYNKTSYNEKFLYCILKKIFSLTNNRIKLFSNEIDIFIPEINIGIEYDGYYWHKNKTEKDIKKINDLKLKGIDLIRIREERLPILIGYENNTLEVKNIQKNDDLQKIFKLIKKYIKKSNLKNKNNFIDKINEFNVDEFDSREPYSYFSLITYDKEKRSNERIINFYNIHKKEITNDDVFKKFLLLVYSKPSMNVFDKIQDEKLIKKFYDNPDRHLVVEIIIKLKYIDDLNYLEKKIKEIIIFDTCWFESFLNESLEYLLSFEKLSNINIKKLFILKNMIDYFYKSFPNWYRMEYIIEISNQISKLCCLNSSSLGSLL